MDSWIKISLLLCLFGFLKEFRPSEPFLVHYLTGPYQNLTNEQMNQDLFPASTYSYMTLLVVVFLITDLLRYKPLVVTEGCVGVFVWGMLTWGRGYTQIMTAEIFFGLFAATEVAYYTYIYARVDREHYQKVTSHTRTAILLGHSISASVGQLLILFDVMDIYSLNYITFTAISLSTIWAFLLPPVKQSLYFHRNEKSEVSSNGVVVYEENNIVGRADPEDMTMKQKYKRACKLLWKDFVDAYTNPYVLKWSIWWALGACGYAMGYEYNQVLYETILKESGEMDSPLYNGAVETISSLLGAATAFGCGWLKFNWEYVGDIMLAVGSVTEGVMLYIFAISKTIWLGYASYTVFVIAFQALITITSAEVARNINEDSYGLIFGINTFFSLVLQSIVTILFLSRSGLALSSRPQFVVYGGYFCILGVVYGAIAVYTMCCNKSHRQRKWFRTNSVPVSQSVE